MAQKDPTAVAARWAQNLGAAGQAITDGVNAVTVAPGMAAARQKSAWVQNTTQAADKWAARTAAVPLSEWQQAMISKGVNRIGTGATAAQPKFATFMTKLLPYINTGVSQLPARGNFAANTQRMVAWATYMHNFPN